MCIVIICDTKAPDLAFLEQCEFENGDGAGIAWRADGAVQFSKGVNLTAKGIHAFIQTIPLPYVIHFRVASVGRVSDKLCHPFPIGGDLAINGAAPAVLFHNGTWQEYEDLLYRTFPTPLPTGEWSDSRAMAYVTSLWTESWLTLPAQHNRICVMDTENIRMYGDWKHERGYWLSHTMVPRLPATTGYTGTLLGKYWSQPSGWKQEYETMDPSDVLVSLDELKDAEDAERESDQELEHWLYSNGGHNDGYAG